jgi:hypothetical protein
MDTLYYTTFQSWEINSHIKTISFIKIFNQHYITVWAFVLSYEEYNLCLNILKNDKYALLNKNHLDPKIQKLCLLKLKYSIIESNKI